MSGYDIEKLSAMLAQATPGPWKMWGGWGPVVNDERQRMAVGRVGPDGGGGLTADSDRDFAPTRDIYGTREDFEMIAALVNSAPAMLHDLKLLAAARDSGVLKRAARAFDENDLPQNVGARAFRDAEALFTLAAPPTEEETR